MIGPGEVIRMTKAMIPMGMAMITNATKALTRSMIPLSKSAQETSGVERKTSIGRPANASKSGFEVEV